MEFGISGEYPVRNRRKISKFRFRSGQAVESMCIVNPWIYSKYSSMWCSNRQSLRFCSKFSAAHKAARPIRNKKTFQKDDVICTINRCNTKHRLLGTIIAIGAGLAYTFRHKYWMPIAHATQLQQLETSNRNQFNFFTDIVEQSAPAVVCIGLRDEQRIQQDEDECLSSGSGFIIYPDGLILTNAHVVLSKPDTTVVVKLYDGRSFDARIETVDQSADLAVVQIKCRDLPTLKLGRSSDLRAGELVMAMGCPMTLENSVTVGVISSVQKTSQDLALEGEFSMLFWE